MSFVVVALAVVVLLVLMTKFKLNGFIALLIVSVLVGLAMGVPVAKIPGTIEKGLGGQLQSTAFTIGLGAMIGRVLGDAGAAQRIAMRIVDAFGPKGVQWAMVITSVLVGITMFYEVAFVIVVPIAFTLVRATKANLLWVGLPMSITMSTMHSFLPPHPGPTAVAGTYHASAGLTLAYGLLIAVPIGAFIAMTWPRLPFIKRMNPSIPEGLVSEKLFAEDEMPGFGVSLAVTLVPVILIAGGAIIDLTMPKGPFVDWVDFVCAPTVALLLGLIVAMYVFGPRIGRSLADVARSCVDAAKSMAMILLVIGAGGSFKEILTAAGIAKQIADATGGWKVSPIILAWIIAVILRIALGSATVAVVTAAGVAAPLVASSGVSPEIMVLATSCGSIAFSHVNDPGFWMYKEYFNLSVLDAIKSRTSYTTVLAILGLGGCLLLNLVFH